MGRPFKSHRQTGSPDFSAAIGETLDEVVQELAPLPRKGDNPKLPPSPQGGASFLDDTYLWSHNREWLVKALATLEEKLGKKNLFLNAKKTHAMANCVDKTPLHIGGKEVQIQEGDAVMQVLGSPVSFDNVPAVILGEQASEHERLSTQTKTSYAAKHRWTVSCGGCSC